MATRALRALLVAGALLLGGCGARSHLTAERHTLVRDSVAITSSDTLSVVWRYRIETTLVNDTVRHVTEVGEVAGTGSSTTRTDSVFVVRRDTIAVQAPAPAQSEKDKLIDNIGRATIWLASIIVVLAVCFALRRLMRRL